MSNIYDAPEGYGSIMNPLWNVNGPVTDASKIWDAKTKKSQAELNELIGKFSIKKVQYYYAIHNNKTNAPEKNTFREDGTPVWIPNPWTSVEGYNGPELGIPNMNESFPYLWKYSIITFEGGLVSEWPAELIDEFMGFGADRVIDKITYYYTVTNSSDTPAVGKDLVGEDGSPIWKKYSPATNNVNRWIWEWQEVSYTNGDVEDVVRCIGVQGEPGIDGSEIEYFYLRSKSALENTDNGKPKNPTPKDYESNSDYQTKEDYVPTVIGSAKSEPWTDEARGLSEEFDYEWVIIRRKDKKTGLWKEFSDPIIWAWRGKEGPQGGPGVQGNTGNAAFKSMVFCRSEETPDTPKGGSYEKPWPTIINEETGEEIQDPDWSDGIPSDGSDKIWMSSRVFSTASENDTTSPATKEWTKPALLSDSADVEYMYSSWKKCEDLLTTLNGIHFSKDKDGNINSDWEIEANNKGWYDDPGQCIDNPEESDNNRKVWWMAITKKSANGNWSEFEISQIRGEDGQNGTSINIKASYPDLESFLNGYTDNNNKILPGWAESYELKNNEGEVTEENLSWVKWIDPSKVEGYTSNSCFLVGENLWVWDGSDEWKNIGRIQGPAGEPGKPGDRVWLHVKYARSIERDSEGNITYIGFTDNDGEDPGKWMGTYSDWEEDDAKIPIQDADKANSVYYNGTCTWIKSEGDDGYGYEYIYCLTETEIDRPAVPTAKYDENGDEVPVGGKYFKDNDYVPEGWHDNPQSIDMTNQFCWMCYRRKVDSETGWGKFIGDKSTTDPQKAVLWSRLGEKGNGILYIARYYAVNNDKENAPEINEDLLNGSDFDKDRPSDLPEEFSVEVTNENSEVVHTYTWYKKSPATTEETPELWQLDITYYTYLKRQYDIRHAGSKGENGIDGTDIEWIFCLSSAEDIIPTNPINDPSKDSDDWWKDDEAYQTPDYDPENFTDSNNHDWNWTDDPISPSSNMPIVWCCRRKTYDDEEKGRIWGPYSDPTIWAKYSKDGKGITKIDLAYLVSDYNVLSDEIINGTDYVKYTYDSEKELLKNWTNSYYEDTEGNSYYESWKEDKDDIKYLYIVNTEIFKAYKYNSENKIWEIDENITSYVYKPNCWYPTSPAVSNEYEYLWKRTITTISSVDDDPNTEFDESNPIITTTYELIGVMGREGVDGDKVDYIYTYTEAYIKPNQPTEIKAPFENPDNNKDYHTYTDSEGNTITETVQHIKSGNHRWYDEVYKDVDSECSYLWISTATATSGYDESGKKCYTWGSYSEPKLWAKFGNDGQPGKIGNAAFKSTIFAWLTTEEANNSDNKPSLDKDMIEEGKYYNTYDYPYPNPNKGPWNDGIPEQTNPDTQLYTSWRIFTSDGKAPQTSDWSDPIKLMDTESLEIMYSVYKTDYDDGDEPKEKYSIKLSYGDNINFGRTRDNNGNTIINPDWEIEAKNRGWYNNPPSDKVVWRMAITELKDGSWTNWKVTTIKGESGEDGTSIKIKRTLEHYTELPGNLIYVEETASYYYWTGTDWSLFDKFNIERVDSESDLPNFPMGDNYYITEQECKVWEYKDNIWVEVPGYHWDNKILTDYTELNDHIGPLESDTYVVKDKGGNLFVWDGDSWNDCGTFQGQASYLHIKYANRFVGNDTTGKKIFYINENGKFTDDEINAICLEITSGSEGLGENPGDYIGLFADQIEIDPGYDINDPRFKKYVWKYNKGKDGYGYEYIYCLTKTIEERPDVPLAPNEYDEDGNVTGSLNSSDPDWWKTDEKFQQSEYLPYGWTDNPQDVTKDEPYCWQCRRIRVDGQWQQFQGTIVGGEEKPWLFSKFSKDGNGIISKTVWYLVSDSNDRDVISEITDIGEGEMDKNNPDYYNHWWPNSPETESKTYRFLWKKTIEVWFEKINEEGTVTNEGNQVITKYELIGAYGDPGVDGTDREWAFKLTTGLNRPSSADDDWPDNPKNPSKEINGTEPGQWTDDPQDIGSGYKYQWVITRTKNKDGNWGPWGTQAADDYYYASLYSQTSTVKEIVEYYKATETKEKPDVPDLSGISDPEKYKEALETNGWKDDGSGVDSTNKYLWSITLTVYDNNTFFAVGPTFKGNYSESARFKSTVFCRHSGDISDITPRGGSYYKPWPDTILTTNNAGEKIEITWGDGIPEGKDTLWTTSRVFYDDESKNSSTQWSDPTIVQDTSDEEIMYSWERVVFVHPGPEVTITDSNKTKNQKKGCISHKYINSKDQIKYFDRIGETIPNDWETEANNRGWYDEPTELSGSPLYQAVTKKQNDGTWSEWVITKIYEENPRLECNIDNITVNYDPDSYLIEQNPNQSNTYSIEVISTSGGVQRPFLNKPVISYAGNTTGILDDRGKLNTTDNIFTFNLTLTSNSVNDLPDSILITDSKGDIKITGKITITKYPISKNYSIITNPTRILYTDVKEAGLKGIDVRVRKGTTELTSSEDLKANELKLYYNLGGEGELKEVTISTEFKIDYNGDLTVDYPGLESGLILENRPINWEDIKPGRSYISLYLYNNNKTACVATQTIVVEQSLPGPAGEPGAMLYPQGSWSEKETYQCTLDESGKIIAKPFVYHNGKYYVLNTTESVTGTAPGTSNKWAEFTKIQYVFTEALMANWAKLAQFVIYDNMMFSQYGHTKDGSLVEYTKNDDIFTQTSTSTGRVKFSGEFMPNGFIDAVEGAISCCKFSEQYKIISREGDNKNQYYKMDLNDSYNISIVTENDFEEGETINYNTSRVLQRGWELQYQNQDKVWTWIKPEPNLDSDFKASYSVYMIAGIPRIIMLPDFNSTDPDGTHIMIINQDSKKFRLDQGQSSNYDCVGSPALVIGGNQIAPEDGKASIVWRGYKVYGILLPAGATLKLRSVMRPEGTKTVREWYVENAADFEQIGFDLSIVKTSEEEIKNGVNIKGNDYYYDSGETYKYKMSDKDNENLLDFSFNHKLDSALGDMNEGEGIVLGGNIVRDYDAATGRYVNFSIFNKNCHSFEAIEAKPGTSGKYNNPESSEPDNRGANIHFVVYVVDNENGGQEIKKIKLANSLGYINYYSGRVDPVYEKNQYRHD